MLHIRLAGPADAQNVFAFYRDMIDLTANARYKPGWKHGLYPTEEDLLGAIRRQELYVGFLPDGTLAAAMVFNHGSNDGYTGVTWPTAAAPEEVMVIHLLAIHPAHNGKGMGKALVRFALDTAREKGQKAVRLDVLSGNLPAEKLYTAMGFQYVTTVSMYYPNTGLTDFLLYEYPL